MAYLFVKTNGDDISFATTQDYTSKVSISVFFKLATLPSASTFVFVSKGKNNSATDRNIQFDYRVNGGVKKLYCAWTNPVGTFIEYGHAIDLNTGQWYHGYLEVDWSTNPDTISCWLDGVSKAMTQTSGGNNVSPTTGATQEISIGEEHGNGGNNMDGLLAEVGIWSDTIGANRASALASGQSPLFFYTNLTFYAPLTGRFSAEPDILSANTGVISGAVRAPHPPQIVNPFHDPQSNALGSPKITRRKFFFRGRSSSL